MAESTVKALERQLASLQKLCASLDSKGFPGAMLIYGKKTSEEVRAEVERQLDGYGLSLVDLEALGLMDQITICSLPWLQTRSVGKGTLPMPGSE